MDHKTSLVDDIEEKTTFKTRKWIMFVMNQLEDHFLQYIQLLEKQSLKMEKSYIRR